MNLVVPRVSSVANSILFLLLPLFQVVIRLSSIVHIHIDINESRYI